PGGDHAGCRPSASSGEGRGGEPPRPCRAGRRAAQGRGRPLRTVDGFTGPQDGVGQRGAMSMTALRGDRPRPARLFADEAAEGRVAGLVERIALRIAPRSIPRAGDHRIDRKRVYILPSRAGLLFAGAMATMLLATINYSLALGYVLTFVLASVGLVSLLHTYRNLAGLVLRPVRADPVHAGEVAELSMTLRNPSRLSRYALQIDVPGNHQPVVHDIAPGAERMATVALATDRRGWLAAPRLRLSTTFPLGLW